jgi:hypothetical protein
VYRDQEGGGQDGRRAALDASPVTLGQMRVGIRRNVEVVVPIEGAGAHHKGHRERVDGPSCALVWHKHMDENSLMK